MTLGTGIFAATALVVFYLVARQVSSARRWRLVGKVVAVLLTILTMGVGAVWMWGRWADRPQPVDELAGIRLGMTPVEVKLAKGKPSSGDTDPAESTKDDVTAYWTFGSDLDYLGVEFLGRDSSSLRVTYICERDGHSGVLGLRSYSTEESVREALGKPTSVSIKKDALSQMLNYRTWNVAFELQEGRVRQVCVSNRDLHYGEERSR